VTERSLEALRSVAGPVSRETFERLKEFELSFLRWSERINLAAPSTLKQTWSRHILDSAQLVQLAPVEKRWLDLGSGGGFPGGVVAVLLLERDGAYIDLVESNRKKAAFLQSTLGQLRAPARVYPERIENVYGVVKKPEIVTARALAPLPLLLGLVAPWLTGETRGLFHKGRDYRSELKESVQQWSFDLLEHRSIVDPESVVLEIWNLRRR
jgi:16S rRNA (guanine527-N7)-methyltransferase